MILAEQATREMETFGSQFLAATFEPLLQEAATLARQGVRDNFTSSADPDNLSWPPRKVVGDGHPLLIDTGDLLQAATGGGAGHIETIGSHELTFGVDGGVIPYAGIHNFGGETRPMPQREFMGLRSEKIDEIENLLADYAIQNLL